MEPYGEVGVLMNLDGENTGGEILKSLLTSKITKAEPLELNILQSLETRNQPEEQIVLQIGLGQQIKTEFLLNENILQHIPVTYLTTGNTNFAHGSNRTLAEPVTYVLSRDVLPESGYCTLGDEEKVILLQEVSPNETYPDLKAYAVKESQTGESPGLNSVAENIEECYMNTEVQGVLEKPSKKHDESSGSKIQVDRKGSKKQLNKRKNSKLRSKFKSVGKALKNHKKQLKPAEGEERERRNLFELTKLEDNVDQVAERLKIGCECLDSNCFDGLNPNAVFKHRLNIADLTKAEHDMYLMGVIMASIHNLEETCRRKERIRIRSCYAYQGKKVCLTAFLYLQHVTLYQMKILRSHLKTHGVSPRIHGNRGRKPANTFSLDIYRRASNFVQNYIEEHRLRSSLSLGSLSGAHDPKRKEKGKMSNKATAYHLPPECTKRIVHGEYKSFCEKLKPSQKVMKYSTFTSFLKKQFPNVKFHKREEKKQKPEGQVETQRKSDKSVQVENRQPGCGLGGHPYNVRQTEQYYANDDTV